MSPEIRRLIDRLAETRTLEPGELKALLEGRTPEAAEYLFERAREVRHRVYGRDVYLRGIIEFSNYCRNDCLYCGIRRGNRHAERYRLSEAQIFDCCAQGHALGFRTFVLQGGEDPFYDDDRVARVVTGIKARYPDCAVTLSMGEKSRESYRRFREAGADRYLLRHETANAAHYARLHPPEMSLENRLRCLEDLKGLGYQTGCGFMVGSPFQTVDCLVEDLLLIQRLQPEMVGLGPFIPHHQTPFAGQTAGTLELTLFLLGMVRLLLPGALLPATTALGTIHPKGRELGILAGANVVMPNLSPRDVRAKYLLYDNKICTGDEAAECRACLQRRVESIGYQIAVSRGDWTMP